VTTAVPFEYDSEADAASITLRSSFIDHDIELEDAAEGRMIFLSVDIDGHVVGIEILNARAALGPELASDDAPSTRTISFDHDREADAVYITLTAGQRDFSIDVEEAAGGRPIRLAIDNDGHVMGLEILDARRVLGPELTRER
jgi:uncharacterized protein YuzE